MPDSLLKKVALQRVSQLTGLSERPCREFLQEFRQNFGNSERKFIDFVNGSTPRQLEDQIMRAWRQKTARLCA